jgi:uncharacterized membrane protein HdeD (DUF308 family)
MEAARSSVRAGWSYNTPWRAANAGSRIATQLSASEISTPMAHLFLAVFLLVFGLNLLFGLSIPMWVTGVLAVIAGVLLVMEHFRVRVDRK